MGRPGPTWLEVLNRLNPLMYAVDPMRRLVINHLVSMLAIAIWEFNRTE